MSAGVGLAWLVLHFPTGACLDIPL